MRQRKSTFSALFILLIGLSIEAFAQESPRENNLQRKWTLRECIDYAIEHNIGIREQALTVKEAKTALKTTRSSRLPDLDAELNQDFSFGHSQSSSTGIFQKNQAANTGFSLSSQTPIFSGFRIKHQTRADQFNLKAEIESLHHAKENVELHVTALYLDVLFRSELEDVYKEQTEHANRMTERTQALVEAGVLSYSQLLEMKAESAKILLNQTEAANEKKQSLLNLAHSLNISNREDFDIAAPSAEIRIGHITKPDEVYQIARNERPVIKEAEYRLKSSRSGVYAARSGYYPTINLNLAYITGYDHIYNGTAPNRSFPKQLSDNQREIIGLTMHIPLFNRNATINNVRTARLQSEKRKLELENAHLELYKEIEQAYQNAILAVVQLMASEEASEAASEASYYTRERYKEGLSTVYEYSETETKLLSASSALLQAKYELLFRNKILDFYQGIPITLE